MASVIWRYTLADQDDLAKVEMPRGSVPFAVAPTGSGPALTLWAHVDPTRSAEVFAFAVRKTGQAQSLAEQQFQSQYIGTVQGADGSARHVFWLYS